MIKTANESGLKYLKRKGEIAISAVATRLTWIPIYCAFEIPPRN
jgi:hypothetical protein